MPDPRPSPPRLAAACFVAAAAAPIPLAVMIVTVLDGAGIGLAGLLFVAMLVGFPIALVHVVVLGLPLYLLLRRFWRLRWWHAAVAGALLAMPLAWLMWRDGGYAGGYPLAAACGVAGALAFWAVISAGRHGGSLGGPGDVEEIFA